MAGSKADLKNILLKQKKDNTSHLMLILKIIPKMTSKCNDNLNQTGKEVKVEQILSSLPQKFSETDTDIIY